MAGFEPDASAVAQLVAVLGCDEPQARFLLEASQGSADLAIQMFYENANMAPSSGRAPHNGHPGSDPVSQLTGSIPPRPRAQAPPLPSLPGARRPTTAAAARPTGIVGAAINLPFALLRYGLGALWSTTSFGLRVATSVGDRVLPPVVMRTVRGAATIIAGNSQELGPDEQAALFVMRFKAAFGDRHPRWLDMGWKQAAQLAAQQYKFLFVYLHSAEHQDTESFCSNVVTAPPVVEYVNEHFLSWGGDTRTRDCFTLSGQLSVTTYPFIALLAQSGTRTKLVAAVQGVVTADQLMAVLRHAVNEQGVLLAAERAERAVQEMDRSLRAEQNQEYEASLAADRKRDAERAAEREAAAAAEKQRVQEEERARAEAEAAERARIEEAAALQRRREEKRAGLAPEATPGPGSAQVRIRLPDGSNFQRCFAGHARVSEVYDFVDSLDTAAPLKPGTYLLCTNFPRKAYGPDTVAQSLQEAGLVPSALLLVQPDE